MAKPAYVVLKGDGNVLRTQSPDIGGNQPTGNIDDLEKLIAAGYQAVRELSLGNGQMLLVLEKPTP